MTKEEQEQLIKESIETFIFAYTGKRIRVTNDDAQYFTARAMSRLNLSEPSLPSNLDEAAEKNFETMEVLEHENIFEETHRKIFKAGAEWMAGQFQKIEGDLVDWYSTSDGKDYCCGVKTIEPFEVPEGFYIRKK